MTIPPNEWLKSTSSKLKKYNDYREADHKEMYQEEFARLAEKYGRTMAESGIQSCLNDRHRDNFGFKPLPEEFEDYVRSEKEKKGVKFGTPQPNCKLCNEFGWVVDSNKRARKCECRRLA